MIDTVLHIIQHHRFGKCLFAGYLLATFVTMLLVGFTLLTLRTQGAHLRAQGKRQCDAISGATLYWRGTRTILNDDVLPDPSLSPSLRRAMGQLSILLDGVVMAADDLSCGRGAP